MKIYRVIYKSILMDEGEDLVEVKTFLDRNLALDYIKRQIMEIKKEVEDLEDYHVEEDESSYERYLENQIRKTFELDGTPIILEFKNKND